MLPCPECGSDAIDGADVMVTVVGDFEFQGRDEELRLQGKRCPVCGHEFAL